MRNKMTNKNYLIYETKNEEFCPWIGYHQEFKNAKAEPYIQNKKVQEKAGEPLKTHFSLERKIK